MLDHRQVKPPMPIDARRQRCSLNHAQFSYTSEGIRYQCRHCKQIEVVPWDEVLRNYRELVNTTNA